MATPNDDLSPDTTGTDETQSVTGTDKTPSTAQETEVEGEGEPGEPDPLDRPLVTPRAHIALRLEYQEKLRAAEKELEDLRAFRETASKELTDWRGLTPIVQQAFTDKENLAREKAELDAQVRYYRRVAADNGISVDDAMLRKELESEQQSANIRNLPALLAQLKEEMRHTVDSTLSERERRWQEAEQARQAAELKRVEKENADKAWGAGWQEVLKANPAAALIESTVRQSWESDGRKHTPREIYSAFNPMAAVAPTVVQTKAEQHQRLPRTLGSTPGRQQGGKTDDDPTKSMTLEQLRVYMKKNRAAS